MCVVRGGRVSQKAKHRVKKSNKKEGTKKKKKKKRPNRSKAQTLNFNAIVGLD